MTNVRKKWLFSFFTFFGINFLFFIFGMIMTTVTKEKVALASSMLLLGIQAAITYYCAYEEKGTKWLMWLLITLPIGIGKAVQEIEQQGPFSYDFFGILSHWLILTGLILPTLWFWFSSAKLRNENLRLKIEKKKANLQKT